MTDSPDPTPEDLDPVAPGTVGGFDRRTAIIVLGGLAILAVGLAVLRARRPVAERTAGLPINDGDDWETALRASIEHLAAAFDQRLVGIDARIDSLVAETIATRSAAFSAPSATLVESNGGPVIEREVPNIEVGAVEPPPPQPAAVSIPPGMEMSN